LQVIWQIFGNFLANFWQKTITNVSIFLSIPALPKFPACSAVDALKIYSEDYSHDRIIPRIRRNQV
jgi:hypothetical protein